MGDTNSRSLKKSSVQYKKNRSYMIFANFMSAVKCNSELVTCDELMNSDLVTRDEFTA